MGYRTEQVLNDLKHDKKFIENMIELDIEKIDEYNRSLDDYRKKLSEINDLIRKVEGK